MQHIGIYNKKPPEEQNPEKNFFKVLGVIGMFFLSVILFFSVYKLQHKYIKAHNALVDSREELKKLKNNELQTQNSINRLSSSDGIEYEVRDKYRVSKSNEHLIVVINNTPVEVTQTAPKTLFEKIKEWLYRH